LYKNEKECLSLDPSTVYLWAILRSRTFSRIIGIILLACIIIPVAQAVEPLWIVNASPGLDLTVVAISADASTIVAGGDQLIGISRDGKKLWSGWAGELLQISRDGRYIVTSLGPSVWLFDAQGVNLWDHPIGEPVTDISITPDGLIIAAGSGSVVKCWYNSGAGLGSNTTNQVKHLRISPAKDQIVVTTERAIRSFNLSYVPFWNDEEVSSDLIEISADGTHIVTSGGNWIWFYHGSGTRIWDRHVLGGNILSLAYSGDGSTIVTGQDDNTITVLDKDGNVLWTAQAGFWVTSVGVSDNGSVIVAGSMDKKLYIFDRQGTLLGTFQAAGMIKSRSVGVSGDGSRIVAVDGANVYGFSGTQFSRPAPSVTSGVTGNQSAVTTSKTLALISAPTVVATSLPGTEQPVTHIPATTQQSGIPWILTLIPVAVIAFIRQKRRT
jgi:WD40 repeat protein